jgi:hypothetical protein
LGWLSLTSQAFRQFQYLTSPLKLATSEIEDVLQHVWVSGPGSSLPGKLVASPEDGLTKAQAQAMAIDQPVVTAVHVPGI